MSYQKILSIICISHIFVLRLLYAQVAAPEIIQNSVDLNSVNLLPRPTAISYNPAVDIYHSQSSFNHGTYNNTKSLLNKNNNLTDNYSLETNLYDLKNKENHLVGLFWSIRTPALTKSVSGKWENPLNKLGFIKEGGMFSIGYIQEYSCNDNKRQNLFNNNICNFNENNYYAKSHQFSVSNMIYESDGGGGSISSGLQFSRDQIETDNKSRIHDQGIFGLTLRAYNLYLGITTGLEELKIKFFNDIDFNGTNTNYLNAYRDKHSIGTGLYKNNPDQVFGFHFEYNSINYKKFQFSNYFFGAKKQETNNFSLRFGKNRNTSLILNNKITRGFYSIDDERKQFYYINKKLIMISFPNILKHKSNFSFHYHVENGNWNNNPIFGKSFGVSYIFNYN